MVTWDDFNKIWANTSPLTPYEFSDPNYSQGWNFIGSTPPARQMWDSIQKKNDEKFKYLRDNFGTPHIVTQASDMTDTDMVYVYMGSEAGWNSGHWYYYDEGTSSWADGGVYNSVAFVTDTTLSIAGQPADAKATGDALALKSDLAGCTFTGNVSVNADFSVTGDATIGTDLSVAGDSTLTGNVSVNADFSVTGDATIGTDLSVAGDSTLTGNVSASGDIVVVGEVSSANMTTSADANIGGALSVAGASTLTGNVSAGADVTVVGDVSSANIIATNNANIGGNATVTGSVESASLTTTADGTIGGNLSVSGTTALAGTSTAPTPSADDNSTNIATTEYVQTEIKPIETDVDIAEKDIANLKALLQGHLYDYQTDSTEAYTKSVPAGAMPYAGLEKVGGKTVVMNQLVQNGDFSDDTSTGWSSYRSSISVENNALVIKSGSGSGYARGATYDISLSEGHKYYLSTVIRRDNSERDASALRNTLIIIGNIDLDVTQTVATINTPIEDAGQSKPCDVVFTATNDSTYLRYRTGSSISGTAGEALFSVLKVEVIDLTLMFGAGNEPSTVEEFQQMFPADYYEYNEGELLSAGVTSVAIIGSNLIDESKYHSGYFDAKTATITPGSGTWRDIFTGSTSSNASVSDLTKILFLPKGSYVVSTERNGTFKGRTVGSDGSIIDTVFDVSSSSSPQSVTFSLTTDSYLTIRMSSGGSSIVGLRINKGSTALPYKPYMSNTYPIPAEIQALEGYGWSCPDHYNYIDYENKKYVQEVGSRAYASGDESDSTVITDGTTTYYPLTTAVETDISAYITDDNLIQVEAGGTLTFENQHGDDYRIPVPSEETYMIDLQSALGE